MFKSASVLCPECSVSQVLILLSIYIFKGGNLMQSEMFALTANRKDLSKG